MRVGAEAWRSVVLAVLAVVTACKAEPDFDERYDAARKEIEETSDRIDRDLKAREQEALKAGNTLPPPSPAASSHD
ncbi:MAG TPA: hypothetical protein VJM34_00220 [Novosphingobium sp.]|nr:hypothetical protein [Novosphingobium sp.]